MCNEAGSISRFHGEPQDVPRQSSWATSRLQWEATNRLVNPLELAAMTHAVANESCDRETDPVSLEIGTKLVRNRHSVGSHGQSVGTTPAPVIIGHSRDPGVTEKVIFFPSRITMISTA